MLSDHERDALLVQLPADMGELTADVRGVNSRLERLSSDVSDLKGGQRKILEILQGQAAGRVILAQRVSTLEQRVDLLERAG